MRNAVIACTLFVTASGIASAQLARGTPEFEQRLIMDRDRQVLMEKSRHLDEAKLRQDIERREFEVKFDAVIKAMNAFIARYNEGNGLVWPKVEADRLGKAMRSVNNIFERDRKHKESKSVVVAGSAPDTRLAVEPGDSQHP